MRRLREIEAKAARPQTQHKRCRPRSAAEKRDLLLALRGGKAAVQKRDRLREAPLEQFPKRLADLGVLRKDENRFSVLENRLDKLDEAICLAARDCLAVKAVAGELEPRQKREDVALPPLSRAVVGKRALVFRALRRRKRAVFAHFALLPEFSRHSGVALEPAQDERLESAAQLLSLRGTRICRKGLHKAVGERFPVAEKTRVEELLETPDVRDRVLYRRWVSGFFIACASSMTIPPHSTSANSRWSRTMSA